MYFCVSCIYFVPLEARWEYQIPGIRDTGGYEPHVDTGNQLQVLYKEQVFLTAEQSLLLFLILLLKTYLTVKNDSCNYSSKSLVQEYVKKNLVQRKW